MGNGSCLRRGADQQQANTTAPPRTLKEMLKLIKDIDVDDIDKTINANLWAQKFKSYLEKRNAEDVQSLKFLTKMEAFVRNESNNSDPKLLKQNRQVLFKKIVSAHFNEDCDVLAISSGNVSD